MNFLEEIQRQQIEFEVTEESLDEIRIDFGDIKNENVAKLHSNIEEALKHYKPNGEASIISTEGEHTTFVSMLFFRNDKPLKIEYI